MTICGIDIGDPDPREFPRYCFGEYSEGKRTRIKYAWFDSYHIDNGTYVCWSHKATVSNYGSVTFDDKSVKDGKEIEWLKKFIGELKL